ncbi:polyketide synthase [Caballeronia udeis]|uniref:Polyketide synthase n=1 Tax=Caballeronia udeis TaxID=1232866 RepID=A0A158GLA0_9BURK|nr:SDR family NAD(P)-dependent oxidoreductase [Caballeronia udeis]SAL32898.1 polyketide synthase [Caballeronia udeis]
MRRELEGIYRELTAGTLSQQDALRRIKSLREVYRNESHASLLASARWEPAALPTGMAAPASASADEHYHVLFYGLPATTVRAVMPALAAHECVALTSEPGDDVAQAYARVALAVFSAVKRVLQARPTTRVRVQLVVGMNENAELLTGVAGLFETAALENPHIAGQIVFVQADVDAASLAGQLRADARQWHDKVVRHAAEGRLARRWHSVDDATPAAGAGARPRGMFKEDGVYLITGGLGGLGRLFAKEILGTCTRARVILTGRSALDDTRQALLRSLQPHGELRAEYHQLDVVDSGQVGERVSAIVREHRQLNGIIHSAGLLRDEFILKKSAATFDEVLAPKVAGSHHLDQASQSLELDFLLLFSSIASWAGNLGQADYAAANGFMDEFAGYRNRLVAAGKRRGQTLAIAWPHWIDGGMNVDALSMEALEQRTGLRSLGTAAGMQALMRGLALGRGQVMVMHGDETVMRRALLGQPSPASVVQEAAPGSTNAPLSAPGDLLGKTRALLSSEFAVVLKMPVERIELRAPLEKYGIDSILAMSLTSRLEATFGTLPKTLFFEYQTVAELADYFVQAHSPKLATLLAPREQAPAARSRAAESVSAPAAIPAAAPTLGRRPRARYLAEPAEAPATKASAASPHAHDEPIAIVGLSGRYPEAADLEAFWQNLRDGKDCIVEVPGSRWNWRDYYSEDKTKEGAHFSKWGGFIEGVDEFDPRFFNIAPREAAGIDPQERLFLQHAWMAIEDAGYTRADLQIPHDGRQPGQVGVYAGVMYGEYNLSGTLANIANRVSYFLNLHGPSLTLDTMCSSSLMALHLACQDLKLGRTSLAIAGGVNVSIHPNKYTMLSGGQFISTDGHCQSFGEGGDGYIPGEGVGVAVLKRLSDAERDGNVIYGVIKGSALNHGGKTNGYTVPNPQAQADVIRQALADAGIDARQVGYIEAHGTGTKLGDPIEIAALTKAFYDGAPDSSREFGYCRIGSAKSNIGHCESAAGIAGVTKVLLQMKHGVIVPSLHSRRLNPHIDFDATPFVVNQSLTPWEPHHLDGRSLPRIAGISSFGAGGSNAHVIIEEYRPAAARNSAAASPIVVPLSARTTDGLQRRARDLAAFLQRDTQIDPEALAYTLQVGREAMEERVVFVVDTLDELSSKLQAFLRGDATDSTRDPVYRARVKPRDVRSLADADAQLQAELEQCFAQRALALLAQHWVQGLQFDWRRLHARAARPRLMSLPTYPFAKERYWIDPVRAVSAPAETVQLHPLVHLNTSILSEQSYASCFEGNEPFLDDDGPGVPKRLPELLALEMIRFAVESAAPRGGEAGCWEICDTVWGDAITVSGERTVRMAILAREVDRIDVELFSTGASAEAIHCQSRAEFSRQIASERLDLAGLRGAMRAGARALPAGVARLYEGEGQWLAELASNARPASEPAQCLLSPELLKRVAGLVDLLVGQPVTPVSLACLRVLGALPDDVVLCIRLRASASADIDLCNAQGDVCAQMQGLSYCTTEASRIATEPQNQQARPTVTLAAVQEAVAGVAQVKALMPAPVVLIAEPREIALAAGFALVLPPMPLKPGAITLCAAAEVPRLSLAAKGTVTLRDTGLGRSPMSAPSSACLHDLGAGVFRIELQTDLNECLVPLAQALERARQEASLKVVLLVDRCAKGWHGGRAVCNEAITRGVLSAVATFPYPVIAVAPSGATGAGALLGAVCDFMVLGEDSEYTYTDADTSLFPSASEERFLRERFGDVLADDFLYRSARLTGRQLKQRGWTCRIAPAAQAEADARQLADDLAHKSPLALRLLKAHLARRLSPLVADLVAGLAVVDSTAVGNVAPNADGGLLVELGAASKYEGLAGLAAELKAAFAKADASPECRVIVLTNAHAGSLADLLQQADREALAAFTQTMLGCPLPLVAAFDSGAEGLAWLLGLWCDACVYQAHGRYSLSGLAARPALEREAAALAVMRLGTSLGQEICLTGDTYTGLQLQARSGALLVAEPAELMPRALALAAFWSRWPRSLARERKAAHAERLRTALSGAPQWQASAEVNDGAVLVPTAIALRSAVVSALTHPDGVVVVTMADREAKNMFSPALVDGLKEVFTHIEQNPSCKVVVLSGYDSYFATGGTRETLLAIQEGQAQFTDEKVFQLPMDCPVPVIAALQGHGIGGGWSFGMFADVVMLSEESRYLSPYMGYGFTPGAGSTLVFPHKIGHDLARETLISAREMSGHELQMRGLRWPVLPRRELVAAAIGLAHRMARQPRERLSNLKRQWTHGLRAAREDVYQREIGMHEQTFVRNAGTLERIQARFGDEPVQPTPSMPTASASASASAVRQSASIIEQIRQMLAQELFLQPGEIDDDAQFIDLGLDSITGVTWIRRINAHFGTDIEATKVYSHSNLSALGSYVASVANIANETSTPAQADNPVPAVASVVSVAAVASTTASDTRAEVIETLKRLLASELHLHPDEIDESAQFMDVGLDSITGVTWVRKINERYGINIEATKVYSHPNLVEISAVVRQEADRAGTLAPAAAMQAAMVPPAAGPVASAPIAMLAAPAASRTTLSRPVLKSLRGAHTAKLRLASQPGTDKSLQPIAVIGMAGQFPKARDIEEFWRNLESGRDCIDEIPDARWRLRDFYQEGAAVPGRTNSRWLGALDEYDLFDPLFFNISPTEAECMDPQQRVFLQSSWHCIENASYSAQTLSGSQCGVFVGCGPSDYHVSATEERLSAQGFTGAATSILAARISYLLNLRGPCLSIDTACSSSLVAIATACDNLNAGNCDLALAGGVYVMAGPSMHIMTAQAGMLSPDGRCFSFDQRANGFVPGEGVGVLMLKRLADAERDGDRIQAVIHGWGVNQDGKTNGITAPNEDAQSRLLSSVYRKFDIDPAGIGLVEAHGTGTKLGDPIEVAGLKAAFKPFTADTGFCALGTVKSNIGHCLTAAGAAGIIKLVLALQHKQLPPTINYRQCNEHIQLKGSPFYVNDRLNAWKVEGGRRRRAAISSFGFGGTNAHIVLGEYAAPAAATPAVPALVQDGKIMVPLSARNEEQLHQKAHDLLAFIRRRNGAIDLAELAYTLQVGRVAMGDRLCVLAATTEALADRLDAYLTGGLVADDVYQGQLKRHKEAIKLIAQDDEMRSMIIGKWVKERKLTKLVDLWVKGLDVDWNLLYGEAKPRRIELPNYPFARQRFWIQAAKARAQDVLHPLVHRNVSLLSRQRYLSLFSGDECFFDQRVNGEKVLSAMAMMEMATAAIEAATADLGHARVVELRQIRWADLAIVASVEGTSKVAIDLYANDDGSVSFDIQSAGVEGAFPPRVYAQGEACLLEPLAPVRVDIAALIAHGTRERREPAAVYAELARAGIAVGPALRGLKALYCGDDGLVAEIVLPAAADPIEGGYAMHPGVIEGAVQAAMVFAATRDLPMRPMSLDSLTVASSCRAQMFAWVRDAASVSNGPHTHHSTLDVDLVDAEGCVCIAMRGLTLAPAVAGEPGEAGVLSMKVPVWKRVADISVAAADKSGERIVVVGASAAHAPVLERQYRDSALRFVDIGAHDAVAGIADKLAGIEFDRLIWIARAHDAPTLTEESIITDQDRGIMQVLTIARALVALGFEQRAIEWDLFTLDALTLEGDAAANPAHAGLQGFSGALAETYPFWKVRLLDLPGLTDTTAAALRRAPVNVSGASYALRDGQWFNQQLVALEPQAAGPSPYRTGGVYVVIGGAGGIGEIWSRHAIEQSQANVIWIGRRVLDESIQRKIDRLAALGKAPEYLQADASRPGELEAAYRYIKHHYTAIHGVVHSAVGAFDQSLKTVSEADFRSILSVKIDLSVRIAQVFASEALDFALFFSSNASFVRGAGMSGYAAGCSFKDAFATRLGQLWPCAVKVVNWGYWNVGAGEAMSDEMKDYFRQTGYRPLTPQEGMQALDAFIVSDVRQISITKSADPAASDEPMTRATVSRAQAPDAAPVRFPALTEERGVRPANADTLLHERTVQLCKQLIGRALKMQSHQLDATEPLASYGIDSIVVGLVNQQMQRHFGEIGATLLYQFRTIDALSDHLVETQRDKLERLFELDRPGSAGAVPAAAPSALERGAGLAVRAGARIPLPGHAPSRKQADRRAGETRGSIAIVGISGLYPNASNLREFWENLKAGRNCIGEIPARRWSLDGFYVPDEHKAVEESKSYCKWGGFVDQFAQFDTLFFGIPPREALNMDPQERMFLQAAWSALESAGYTRRTLREQFGGRVGVFAGITRAGYNLYRTTSASSEKFWPRTSFASVANRLSYFLDINGPSLPVDTMCSSSLTAIHEACEHIANGDCDLAFAGGANLYLHPTSYVDMSSQHMLSPNGKCKSFGEGGDGFVPGEGVGVVLLKPLERAIADGDIIHAVILATNVNHGGKTSGYTVPNPVAQAELIRRAIDKAGISAREVSYIEAHGTGTELGDPIEISGLQQAFAPDTAETGYCAIGSVKSNIGHLEAAAGVAALTKVLLQFKHRQIAPSLHARALNPHIKFDATAFRVSQTLSSWEPPVVDGVARPRIAGISSFGAGGANAHVIVREYRPAHVESSSAFDAHGGSFVIPLSARTPEQLLQKASDLFEFLSLPDSETDLAAIAYTLQIGREPMEERLGFVVSSVGELTRQLTAYVCGDDGAHGVYRGQPQRSNDGLSLFVQDGDVAEAIEKWIAHGKHAKLVELWVKGVEFDWNRLYGATRPRRVELPTYPFAKDEYWIDSVTPAAEPRAPVRRDVQAARDFGRIEEIIRMIDASALDAGEGARLLKSLV